MDRSLYVAMNNNIDNNNTPEIPALLKWLFPYKRKGLSVSTQSRLKYYIFQNRISLLLINWIFQGMRGMGRADLIGKIILEIIFFSIFFIVLEDHLEHRVLLSLVFAHTLNWLLNAHFWDVGRFMGITSTPPSRFFPYLRKLEKRLRKDSSPAAVIIIGGLSRNKEFTSTSDVDMIFISDKGLPNSIKAVLVTIRERAIAFFCKFPLHLELYDNMQAMKKHRVDEVPVILKDTGQVAEDWYRRSGRDISCLSDYDPGP